MEVTRARRSTITTFVQGYGVPPQKCLCHPSNSKNLMGNARVQPLRSLGYFMMPTIGEKMRLVSIILDFIRAKVRMVYVCRVASSRNTMIQHGRNAPNTFKIKKDLLSHLSRPHRHRHNLRPRMRKTHRHHLNFQRKEEESQRRKTRTRKKDITFFTIRPH